MLFKRVGGPNEAWLVCLCVGEGFNPPAHSGILIQCIPLCERLIYFHTLNMGQIHEASSKNGWFFCSELHDQNQKLQNETNPYFLNSLRPTHRHTRLEIAKHQLHITCSCFRKDLAADGIRASRKAAWFLSSLLMHQQTQLHYYLQRSHQ